MKQAAFAAILLMVTGASAASRQEAPGWLEWPGVRKLYASAKVVGAEHVLQYEQDPKTGLPGRIRFERVRLRISTDRLGIVGVNVTRWDEPPKEDPAGSDIRTVGPLLADAVKEIRRQVPMLAKNEGPDLLNAWDTIQSRLAITANDRARRSLLLRVGTVDLQADESAAGWGSASLVQLAEQYGTDRQEWRKDFDDRRGKFAARIEETRGDLVKTVRPYDKLRWEGMWKEAAPEERDRIVRSYAEAVVEFACRYLEEYPAVYTELSEKLKGR